MNRLSIVLLAIGIPLLGIVFMFTAWAVIEGNKRRWDGGVNFGAGGRPAPLPQVVWNNAPPRGPDFQNAVPLDEQQIRREIGPVLDSLGTAFRNNDIQKIADALDTDKIADAFLAQAKLPPFNEAQRNQFMIGFRAGFGRNFAGNQLLAWEKSKIKTVQILNPLGDAVLFVRHSDHLGDLSKMRWWVTKRQGTWRIYDFEDLDAGIRLSTLMGGLAANGLQNVPTWAGSMPRFAEATQLILQGDDRRAEEILKSLADVKFPPQIEGIRITMLGVVKMRQGRYEEALDHFKRADVLHPDMPARNNFRATVYNDLRQYENALASLKKYTDLLGHDRDTHFEEGLALAGLKRKPEAAVAFRHSLDDDPDAVGALKELRKVLAADEKKELGKRFAKMTRQLQFFKELAADACFNKDVAALAEYDRVMAGIDPELPDLHHYRFRARLLEKKPDEAAKQLKIALAKPIDDHMRRTFIVDFLFGMADIGKALEGYRLAPDPDHALDILGFELLDTGKIADLETILKEHGKGRKPSFTALRLQAELHVIAKRYLEAHKTLEQAAAEVTDRERLQQLNFLRVETLYRLGKWTEAYETIGDRRASFDQLTGLLSSDKENGARNLQKLLDMHRKFDPQDPDLGFWQAEVHYLKGEYAEAVRLLDPLRHGQNTFRIDDRLLRSLVRLKQLDRAIDEARRIDIRERDRDQRDGLAPSAHIRHEALLVGVCSRDADVALKLLERFAKKRYNLEYLYDDPDMGPALRSPEMARVAERFPEPVGPRYEPPFRGRFPD